MPSFGDVCEIVAVGLLMGGVIHSFLFGASDQHADSFSPNHRPPTVPAGRGPVRPDPGGEVGAGGQGLGVLGPAHPFDEHSANYMWEVLAKLHPNAFLWNAVPLHPRQPGMFDKNRKPTTKERNQFAPLTDGLIAILKPQAVIAVGRVAERALQKQKPTYLRHPSFGGASEFRNGIRALISNI